MKSVKNKVELKRVNINLPSSLVQKVVDYANDNGLNTTSAYIVLLNQALDQRKAVETLPIMLELVKSELAKTMQNEDKKD